MTIQNKLAKMAVFLILLMPLVIVAEDKSKKVDPFAEAKEEPKESDIDEVKLDDIVSGKYSKAKGEVVSKKKQTRKVEKKQQKQQTRKAEKKQPSSKQVKKEIKKKVAVVTPSPPKDISKVERKKEPEMNLIEAYSAVMGTSNTKSVKKKVVKATPPPPKASNVAPPSGTTVGWLYLGKFTQGQWDKQSNHVLGLNGVLPKVNHYYSIRVPSNIRKGKPSKGKMPGVIKVLSAGSKIRVLTAHNSGRSGHYWAKIAW
ncbi:MAG: hypothetical protein KAH03_07180 [Cocleimonas sp.]|nr:hypothetical protein [Cocleimonas sp.]